MTEKGWYGRDEAGQSLVVFLLFILGLLATAALVLDGGNIYLKRRAMQNAADAAALAGARVLAFSGTEAQAEAAAQDYAEQRNGADSSEISFNADDTEITVVVHTDTGMTFARLIGINQVDVGARASAAYASIAPGGEAAPGTLAPIAVRACPAAQLCWDYVDDPLDPGEAHTVTIWDDDTYEGPWDPYNLAGNNRGWLNMDCHGYPDYAAGEVLPEGVPKCSTAGASLLTEWMLHGYSGEISFDTPLWIRGDNGVKARPVAITAQRPGNYIAIPVFDDVREPEPEAPLDAILDLYPGDSYYHVVDLACFYVIAVHATGNPKGLEGYFTTGCAIAGKPGDGGTESPVRTFFLTE